MAGRLNGRVSRLEGDGHEGPCEECGFGGDLSKVKHVVEWVAPDETTGAEWCETCGHQLVYVITWGDDILTAPPGAA